MAQIVPLPLRIVADEWTDRVPSPAHDSVTSWQRRDYIAAVPDSFMAVTRSLDDLPEGVEMTTTELLHEGRISLEALLAKGAFGDQRAEALYVYRLTTEDHYQDGILCGVATEAFETGGVKAHERVFGEQRDHLARHFEIVRTQSSPIVMSHQDIPEVSRILAAVTSGVPLLDFTVPDGLRQTIWPVDDVASDRLVELLTPEPFYIIDGHHRTGAAHAYRQEVGHGTADFMLSAVFSSSQMRNQPFHRWLRNSDDCTWLLDGCDEHFDVRTLAADDLDYRGADELAIYHEGRWTATRLPSLHDGDALSTLDPVRLQRHLLGPLVGIDESAPRSRLDYLSGDASLDALTTMIDQLGGALVMMRPVTMDELFSVADAGQIMPPKSTYFTPKARSGVVLRPL